MREREWILCERVWKFDLSIFSKAARDATLFSPPFFSATSTLQLHFKAMSQASQDEEQQQANRAAVQPVAILVVRPLI